MLNFIKKHIKLIIAGALGSCLTTILMWFVLPLLMFSLIIGAINPIFFYKTKELVQQVINEEVTIASFSIALPEAIAQDITALAEGQYPRPDATPMTPDVYNCEGCNCQKTDYAKTRGTTKKENTLRYDGWTIDADSLGIEYIDCDFGKFYERQVDDKLFKYKISDFKEGKQKMTAYNSIGSLDALPKTNSKITQFDPNAKLEWYTDNPDLKLGNWGSMCTVDGRLTTCLAPMPVVPQSGVQKHIEAKNYFHIGSHWVGAKSWNGHFTAQETGVGEKWLNLWTGAIPTGTYVDVVFENNTTGQQVVVPFIYFEAKDIRANGVDNCYSQFTDQRYGHIAEKITNKANDWIETDKEELLYEYKITGIDSSKDYITNNESRLTTLMACDEQGNGIYQTANGQYAIPKNVGDTFYVLSSGAMEIDWDTGKETGVLKDNIEVNLYPTFEVAKATRTGKTTKQRFLSYYDSENDTRTLWTSSCLETLGWANVQGGSKPNGNWSDATFCAILDKSDCTTIGIPNWHLKATRVYNKKLQDGWWKDIRDKMSSTTISSSNKVINFCSSSCKCTICLKAEARPNR